MIDLSPLLDEKNQSETVCDLFARWYMAKLMRMFWTEKRPHAEIAQVVFEMREWMTDEDNARTADLFR